MFSMLPIAWGLFILVYVMGLFHKQLMSYTQKLAYVEGGLLVVAILCAILSGARLQAIVVLVLGRLLISYAHIIRRGNPFEL